MQAQGNFNTYKRLTLGAGGVLAPLSVTGQFFECKEASHPFEMSFQDGEFFRWDKGRAFRLPELVTRLAFRSLTDFQDDTEIEIYIGNVDILISRPFVTQEQGATVLLCPNWSGYPYIAAGQTVVLDGVPPPGSGLTRRRGIFIQQQVSGNLFKVLDGDNNIIRSLDELPFDFETSGVIGIKNNDGSPHDILVAETWYQSPM